MDLAFTPEEQKFREEIRAWVRENLPKEISNKVHNALHLTREDHQRWAKILGKKGWLGYSHASANSGFCDVTACTWRAASV
jgi:alkylation response protein AidB-like acyl-CoA dehydrogenase